MNAMNMNAHQTISNELNVFSTSLQRCADAMATISQQPAGLPQIQQLLEQTLAGQQVLQAQVQELRDDMTASTHNLGWRMEYNQLRQEVLVEMAMQDSSARLFNVTHGGFEEPLSPCTIPLPPPPVQIPPIGGPGPEKHEIRYPDPFPATRRVLDTWDAAQHDHLLNAYDLQVPEGDLSDKRAVLINFLEGRS